MTLVILAAGAWMGAILLLWLLLGRGLNRAIEPVRPASDEHVQPAYQRSHSPQ